MTPRRPRADAARNRERIVAAAGGVLAQDPRAGMDAVVEASGLARATVYRYFAHREDLVREVVARALDVVAEVLAEARPSEGPAIAALRRLTAAGWAAGAADMALVALVSDGQVAGVAGAGGLRVDRIVRGLVSRAQDEGALRRDVPAAWLADQWFGVLQSALLHPPDGEPDPVSLVVSLFLSGARADAAR